MNQLIIDRLAAQSTDDILGVPVLDRSRFAELIVRECAKRVDYWESRQGEHTEDLLKHFGVE